MEDQNSNPVSTPVETVQPVIVKPLFRDGTACSFVMAAVMTIKGDFDHKDAVNAAKDFSAKNTADVGQVERNTRYVVARLLKIGKLTKVRRGRWIVTE